MDTIDPRQLRDVLGTFVTGVTVVTTCDGTGTLHGVTANSFSSVSLDPPLVLWSQSLASRSHAAFNASDTFAVNILADDQIAVSNQFAKSRDDKFEGVAFDDGIGGVPVLRGTAACLECTKVATYPVGDHTACLGVWGKHGPTIVHWEPSRKPVSEHLRMGLVVSPTRSAVGRLFAAWLPPEVTKPFVDEDLRLFRAPGETAAQQKERFDSELAEFRERGLTRTTDLNSLLHQRTTNAFCAPIRDAQGNVVVALTITSQSDRLDADWEGPAPVALRAAALEISRRLGYGG